MRLIIPALLLVVTTACATGPVPRAELTARQQLKLDKALDGKVAGEPVRCISRFQGDNMSVVSDSTLVYRVNRNLVYRNDLQGSCRGLASGDTLVMELHGNQYCRGEMAHVVDLTTGMRGGSCALGDFIPYRTPESGD